MCIRDSICNDPGVYSCPQCNTCRNNEPLCGNPPHAKSPADSSPTDFSDDDFPSSPGLDAVLTQATHVATLAQQFNLTAFNDFQQVIIDAVFTKRDTLVIQPTGSGKSLCYQFPPVHEQKKGIEITPTISLMQDQVKNLEQRGINAVYLGSAQLDKTAEERAFSDDSIDLIYGLPKKVTRPKSTSSNLPRNYH